MPARLAFPAIVGGQVLPGPVLNGLAMLRLFACINVYTDSHIVMPIRQIRMARDFPSAVIGNIC
ncbi:MAG TPA: hypothetical protein VE111_05115 [Bradyrhizobium sp.]|nr:hypothetical protein [Bradyrhizobium sp.]